MSKKLISKYLIYYGCPHQKGKLLISKVPEEWGGPCKISTEKQPNQMCKVSVIKSFTQGCNYDKIIYFGDGENDLSAVLNLSPKDIVYPRKGFILDELLKKHCVKAQVISWENGIDLLKCI